MTPIPSSKLVRDVAPQSSKESTRSAAAPQPHDGVLPKAAAHRLQVRPDAANSPVPTRYTSLPAFDEDTRGTMHTHALGSSPIASNTWGEPSTSLRNYKREISTHGIISSGPRRGPSTLPVNETLHGRPRREQEGASLSMRTSRRHTSDPLYKQADESSKKGHLPSPTWDQMQNELELLRRAVQDMHRVTTKQNKVPPSLLSISRVDTHTLRCNRELRSSLTN